MVMDKVITVKNLKKSFGKNHVLKGIDLELSKGDNLAILGRSGIGKSVLTKCIIRLIEADSGMVSVLGKDMYQLDDDNLDEMRRRMGYLFQGGALYDSMSVRKNLEFPVRRTQVSRKKGELKDKVEEVLQNVGLIDAIDEMPADLSGGMKKRVALARTLILEPEVILYDEPTTGLDPVTSGEISDLIVRLNEQYHTSSIIITHDMKCARITADKIFLLHNGRLLYGDTFENLSKNKDELIKQYFV